MQRQTFIKALHNRQRREAGWIVSASAENNLCTRFQRALERFDTHLRDDVGTVFNGFVR